MVEDGEFIGYGDALLWAAGSETRDRFPVTCRYCLRCGTLVVSEELHDVWHASHG
jgi:hypothetical protein